MVPTCGALIYTSVYKWTAKRLAPLIRHSASNEWFVSEADVV
jgi:hypothetical protein